MMTRSTPVYGNADYTKPITNGNKKNKRIKAATKHRKLEDSIVTGM